MPTAPLQSGKNPSQQVSCLRHEIAYCGETPVREFWGLWSITDADYADDILHLANALAQAETLLHSLERAAAGIGLHVNAHNGIYML